MTTSTQPPCVYLTIQANTVDTVDKDPGEVLILPLVSIVTGAMPLTLWSLGPRGKMRLTTSAIS